MKIDSEIIKDDEDIPMDAERAVNYIRKHAMQYSIAKAHRIYMEEFRKTLKAQLMKKSGENAVNAQEREAYAHPEYVEHLKAIRESVTKEEYLRWKIVAAEAMIEVWRSQEATKRMEYKGTL